MGGSAAFSGGQDKSQSQGTSEQDSYGYNQAGNQASSQQNVWGGQQDALQSLYGQAGGLMDGSNPYGQAAQGVAGQGAQAWGQQLQPGQNPYFDQAVQASIDQASDSFKRQVLPELESRGVGAGAYGGSRDQLARGEAAGMFGQSIAQTAAQQRAQQYSGDQSRVLQAIGLTPQMQQSQYAPLSVAASLIGGPTVLGGSQSTGFSLGENTSHAQSQQTAKSSGWKAATSGSASAKE